jgi:RNA polymerase sigma factor (sigma-70 family)
MASARSSGAAAGQLGSLYSLGAAGPLTDGQLLERFLTRDDPTAAEAAFTALVDRHSSTVLSVCRRELHDLHDANDAFQATFLVLVTKATTMRHWETVGGWLVGIARRVAARARVDGARRRRHLEQLGNDRSRAGEESDVVSSAPPEVDYAPLIDEVSRLPERFRAPVVLHYFEGLSTEATAQRLGCARGTVLSRLSRARDRIKQRLEDRGLTPAVLIPAGDILTPWLPPVPVPAWLAHGTIRAASSLGLAGAAIESVVPATVANLSRRVARTLALSRVGMAAAMFLATVVGVSIGLAATLQPDDKPQRGAAMEKPQGALTKRQAPRADQKEKAEPLVLRGEVFGPDGKPLAGAELMLCVPEPFLNAELRRVGATGPDGQFELHIPMNTLEPSNKEFQGVFNAMLAAFVPGLGPDWVAIDPKKAAEPITLRLRSDDVPIEGRIINLEGRPVAGVSVKVGYIAEFPPALMSKLRENAGKMNPALWGEMRNALLPGEKGSIRPVQTGADGRFRLVGAGRDRVVLVHVEGGSIEQSFAMVATSGDRDYQPVVLPSDGSGERKIERPRFELSVAPGHAIEGIVRDRDTGQPIPGARVLSSVAGVCTTDAQGRFHIPGQSRERLNFVDVTVEGQPYIRVMKAVEVPSKLGPVRLDITLKRGVWVEGKVIDAKTRKPAQAVVTYYPFRDNPVVKDCPDASFLNNNLSDEVEFRTDATGHFRAIGLPGGGILAVKAGEPGYVYGQRLEDKVAGNVLHAAEFQYYQYPFHELVPIDVPTGESHAVSDIALTPGRTQHIQIVAPDGRPVTGTKMFCFQGTPLDGEPILGDQLTFTHANPGKAESIVIVHEGRSIGAVINLKGDEPDPVRIELKPTGAVTGRLIGEDGKPRAGVHLSIGYRILTRGSSMGGERFGPLTTGPDGRFRITHLVPGVSYAVQPIKPNERNYSLRAEGYLRAMQWTVKPGETQDWGDVQARPYRP